MSLGLTILGSCIAIQKLGFFPTWGNFTSLTFFHFSIFPTSVVHLPSIEFVLNLITKIEVELRDTYDIYGYAKVSRFEIKICPNVWVSGNHDQRICIPMPFQLSNLNLVQVWSSTDDAYRKSGIEARKTLPDC